MTDLKPSAATDPPSVLPPSATTIKDNDDNDDDHRKRISVDQNHRSANSFSRRGPLRWFDYLSGFYLPVYDGPNDVGTLTLELPIPEQFSNYQLSSPMKSVQSPDRPILELNNSLITFFYPTKPQKKTPLIRNVLSRFRNQPRLRWITFSQLKGYLKFANIAPWKRWLILPSLLLTIRSTKLPTRGGAPILTKKPSTDDRSRRPYKLIIFSHGLTGNRTCYSQLCGKLASEGYVVAALEHRDGTSSHSLANERVGQKIVGKNVPYVDMADVSSQTRPEHYFFARAFQLELRTIEILAASSLLSKFSEPNGWKTIRDSNLRIPGSLGWAGDDGLNWNDQQWSDFANAVDWKRDIILAGHSFGAATVITAARHKDRPPGWERFILYDPWIETLEYRSQKFLDEEQQIDDEKAQRGFSCLVINSPGFTDWNNHFERLKAEILKTDERTKHDACLVTTMGGIIHSSFSDLPIVAEWIWKRIHNLKLDSQKALKLIAALTITFIEADLEPKQGFVQNTHHDHHQDHRHDEKRDEPVSRFLDDNRDQKLDGKKVDPDGHPGIKFSDHLQAGKFFVHFKRSC